MENIYSVAISCRNDLGYIEYNKANQTAEVVFANEPIKAKIEEYLQAKHVLQIPHHTLHDFTEVEIEPLSSEENFQLALTRMWDAIGVHVDWSRPVDYVKEHRTLKD